MLCEINQSRKNRVHILPIACMWACCTVWQVAGQLTITTRTYRYVLEANIERVFTKFKAEGKATIRLKSPKLDIGVHTRHASMRTYAAFIHPWVGACVRAFVRILVPCIHERQLWATAPSYERINT